MLPDDVAATQRHAQGMHGLRRHAAAMRRKLARPRGPCKSEKSDRLFENPQFPIL